MPKGSEAAKSSDNSRKDIARPKGKGPGKAAIFVLPELPDPDAWKQELPGLMVQITAPSAPRKFSVLDCHDQSLRKSNRVLLDCAGRVHLYDASAAPVSQRCRAQGKFVADLPEGPVKSGLSKFPKLRALTTIGEGQLARTALSVLDDVQKTQARGTILTLRSDGGQAVIVAIEPLRGYDRAFARVCDMLSVRSSATGPQAIFPLLFPDMQPYAAKPVIPLGKTEPAIEAAADIIHTFLKVARQNESGVIADIDTEFLHDYRVSLRRIRSVLSLFKGVYSDPQTAQLKLEFSELMAQTGRLRDLDVYLLEKRRFFKLVPSTLHAGLEDMFNRFEGERKRALSRLVRQFRSPEYDAQMQHLDDLFRDVSRLDPGPSANHGAYDYARSLIWKRYRKVCKLARNITPETPDEAVHDLRIHCKKLRYLMEFFGPLFDKGAFKTIIKPLKKLQDNLGLFNDCAVQQAALLKFVQQQPAGQTNPGLCMSVGGVIAVLDQKQKFERGRVIANFQHFDSSEIRRLFRTLFHDAKE